MAASLSASLSHFEPLRVRPERRLPADWSLPWHCPAQEARWRSLGKTDMSTPISARMFWAVRVSIPSSERRSSTAGRKGCSCSSIASPLDLLVEEVEVGEDRADQQGVQRVE